jgi:hypothetical protein
MMFSDDDSDFQIATRDARRAYRESSPFFVQMCRCSPVEKAGKNRRIAPAVEMIRDHSCGHRRSYICSLISPIRGLTPDLHE